MIGMLKEKEEDREKEDEKKKSFNEILNKILTIVADISIDSIREGYEIQNLIVFYSSLATFETMLTKYHDDKYETKKKGIDDKLKNFFLDVRKDSDKMMINYYRILMEKFTELVLLHSRAGFQTERKFKVV